MEIPSESFPVMENVTEYQKSNVKVTLNGRDNQIFIGLNKMLQKNLFLQ